jgi:hypothetical protein
MRVGILEAGVNPGWIRLNKKFTLAILETISSSAVGALVGASTEIGALAEAREAP